MNLSKKNAITALLIIILLGAGLRFYKLGESSFVADEFLDMNSTYAYFKTGVWQNWDFNFGKVNTDNVFADRDERSWIYRGQVAELFKFLPPTETVARSVSALWGILSIILIYFVAKYFTQRAEIGLLSAFLFSLNVSAIIYDRKFRMYSMFIAVFLFFSWQLFRLIEDKYKGENSVLKAIQKKIGINMIYLLPALIMGIVSFLTQQLTLNIIFIVAIYAIAQLIILKKRGGNFLNIYSFILFLMGLGLIFSAVFLPKELARYMGVLKFFNNNFIYFIKIFSDYSQIVLASLFLILGIYFLYKKKGLVSETVWLASSFLGIAAVAAFIWSNGVGDRYLLFIMPSGIILIASGIFGLAEFFRDNLPKFKKLSFYIPLLLALLILPNYAYFFQPENTYKQTSESDNPNFRKVFQFFKKAKNTNDVLITRNFRNYYWSGANVKVFDFGGGLEKDKITLEKLQSIIKENPSGWFIISDNDEVYISNDALDYVIRNLERVSNLQVRGKLKVYRWGNTSL